MVEIIITDISGAVIGEIVEGFKSTGVYRTSWSSAGLPSGTYFATLNFEGSSLTKKVVLLK